MASRIYSKKAGALNENDRLEIAKLLIKAGYAVRLGKEKPNPKSTTHVYFVEYWEVDQDAEK